jgi:nucleotide-binding universal stress UspA family protein/regulator of replication initiation timing
MDREKKILFGVDDSVFARQAIARVGSLLKNSEDLKIKIFHGIPELNLLFLERMHLSPEIVENYQKLWRGEEEKVLEQAKEVLQESGFDPDRVATIFEEGCNDPASSMYKLATLEDFEVLALARGRAATPEQKSMGTVTYRLADLTDDRDLWVVDPRILLHDVLLTVVGADISRRVIEHAAQYFGHLRESRFTILHVIPPVPPQVYKSSYWVYAPSLNDEEEREKMGQWMSQYEDHVKEITDKGKERLIKAGVPEENVVIKFQVQRQGIARDILAELAEGNYGILVLGRKGFKDISQFGLGSKANKLLHAAQAFIICLVN